jgi:hypothetical protein
MSTTESGSPVSNQVEVLDDADTQIEAQRSVEVPEQIPCTQKRKQGRPSKKPEEGTIFYAMPIIKDWRMAIDFWQHGDTQSNTPALKTWSKEQIHGVTKANMMKRKRNPIEDKEIAMLRGKINTTASKPLQTTWGRRIHPYLRIFLK